MLSRDRSSSFGRLQPLLYPWRRSLGCGHYPRPPAFDFFSKPAPMYQLKKKNAM
jgi:hypothetical protein